MTTPDSPPSPRALVLERPLVSFDLETTGLSIEDDRIVEICCVKLRDPAAPEIKTRRINPGISIGAEATAVHGITDADVRDCPTFAQVAKGLAAFLEGADLTGFNLEAFDIPILAKEFERAGIRFPSPGVRVIDSRRIYMAKEPRTLAAAYRFYCGRTLESAHSAEGDALAAAEILRAQIARYDDLATNVAALHDFCHPVDPNWVDAEGKLIWTEKGPVLTFGKYRNRQLGQVAKDDPDYLRWIASANFSPAVVEMVKRALAGETIARPAA